MGVDPKKEIKNGDKAAARKNFCAPPLFIAVDFSAVCAIIGCIGAEKDLQFFNIFLLLRKHLRCMMEMKIGERSLYGKDIGCGR